MSRPLAMVLGAALVAWSCAAGAADPAHGKKVADGSCAACHGRNGIGIVALYPNLAGQKMEYLAAQLRAFRDGTRKNPIMSPMAAHLTDTDIEDVSAYLSLLR